jgi:branched-chain amino acid transport system ATP-binding protein
MTTKDSIIEVHNLCKEFKGFSALDNISFSVTRGTIHALIGPNGAGKTTCFNLLTKFLNPTRGSIYYEGRNITHLQPADIACLGIVRSFQISAVFPQFTVMENVRIALQRKRRRHSYDFWRSSRHLHTLNHDALQLIDAVGLTGMANMPATELSYGHKRAVELATTLALEPKVMLLDEPTAGMGKKDIERTVALIRHAAESCTILMVEHNLSVVASLSDHIIVMARGKVLAEGNYGTLSKDARVIEAYIGAGHAE